MSASTWPGPTRGQLVHVPDQEQRRLVRQGAQERAHQRARRPCWPRRRPAGRIPADAPPFRGSRRSADRSPAAGGWSWPRARCSRTAAWRPGRSGRRARRATRLARRILRMALTRVVLPTPGPPVMTRTLEVSARRTAALLALRQREAGPALDPGDRLVGIDRRPGRRAGGERAEPLGDALLGPVKPGEEHASAAPDRVRDHLAGLQLQSRAPSRSAPAAPRSASR